MGDAKFLGLELVQLTTEKVKLIKGRLKTAQSRQKNHASNQRWELEFEEGDFVSKKVSLSKGIVWLERKEKLRARYSGPLEILDRLGTIDM